ncbi:MAG: 4Fe-4S binding protein, partial [Desulfurococcales archaeon]|nr:4Fe-4S binding protein [Desulfurococcales archaeon]
MKLLIEDKLNEIFGIHDAPTVADKGEIETLILKALEESEKVIAFYSDAWKRLPVVRKRAREKGLNYHLYMPVDPLEVKLAYPLDAKALFEAKKSFMLSIKPHRAQKTLSLTKPVSRRNLLRRPLDSVMVYRAVPVIASTPCFQQQHCNACITSCPFQALSGKPPRVDPAKCTSCGLCMGSCPFGFIEMTGLGFEALDYMLAVIRRNLDKPGHMVFSCWDSLPDIANLSASTPTFFVGIE